MAHSMSDFILKNLSFATQQIKERLGIYKLVEQIQYRKWLPFDFKIPTDIFPAYPCGYNRPLFSIEMDTAPVKL